MSALPRHLSTEEMVEAAQVFNEAYQHVVSNLLGETQQKIQRFVLATVVSEKPFLLITPEGLDRAISLVFQDAVVRDFVLTLQYTFGSRWGMSQDKFEGLVANLAVGATPAARLSDSAMPNAIADRLTSTSDAYNLLLANSWLVILMLLLLFLSIGPQKTSG